MMTKKFAPEWNPGEFEILLKNPTLSECRPCWSRREGCSRENYE
jgi:hypothetical protein